MSTEISYALDFEWNHPWPRGPIPAGEESRLETLRQYSVLDTDPEESYTKICNITGEITKCPISAISFIDSSRQFFKASSGLALKEIPRDVAFCAHTIMTPDTPLVIPDTSKDVRFKNNPLVTGACGIRFYAGVCLLDAKTSHPIGTLFVFDTKPRTTENPFNIAALVKVAGALQKHLKVQGKAEKVNVAKTQEVPVVKEAVEVSSPERSSQDGVAPTAEDSLPTAKVVFNNGVPYKTFEDNPKILRRKISTPPPPPVRQASSTIKTAKQVEIVPVDSTTVSPTTTIVEASGGMVGPKMGGMLITLLARTTDTQQQLVMQQGVMHDAIGDNTNKIQDLMNRMRQLEAKLQS